ncbi:TIGR03619 family F420-dependent LLM class oxidoreductase [Nocardia sp. SYP-A9097]|uniref:TIGR03619 family F420-dependent LLM class oxidoreductase n=1 Tax=Nocardia sp. SYP-A9097 TaxID=2663237 RepID=UPI00129A994C|nr:TIGR03619 family F420-dependent LLM class oxidoreductase [Nocardia sp. SYP-A9097]MRH89394.1 TIGR03619 family F420-dependent LLM class oxidoreductase [Nocardia sp. SYP-A9097]
MRIGLSTPIVTAVPGLTSAWESTAGPDELSRVAGCADELGFDHLTCSEHVAVPAEVVGTRGGTYWDPLATLAFLAARTRDIRLVTAVLVLPYHHPLEIAKRYGTLDRLSGGRVVLGVGVGSLREEFELLDARWADRGAVTDARMRELRSAWGQSEVSGMVVSPTATGTGVPLWVGGRTMRSLRRAVELGDGWMPFGLTIEQLTNLLERVDLPEGFDVVLSTGHALDPLGDPRATAKALRRLAVAGATIASCRVAATSAAHYCDQLAALRIIERDES